MRTLFHKIVGLLLSCMASLRSSWERATSWGRPRRALRASLWVQADLGYDITTRGTIHVRAFICDRGAVGIPVDTSIITNWLAAGWRVVTAKASCQSQTDIVVLERAAK